MSKIPVEFANEVGGSVDIKKEEKINILEYYVPMNADELRVKLMQGQKCLVGRQHVSIFIFQLTKVKNADLNVIIRVRGDDAFLTPIV